MVRINLLLLFISFFLVAGVNCQNKPERKRLNLNDSVSVRNFITTTKICDRLNYVENNIVSFVSLEGYTGLILESITKESGKPLFLPISNGGIIESKENRTKMLNEEIFEIKKILKCEE